MAVSPYLFRKLQEALGHEAAEDLVNYLASGESLRADVAELRHEMQLGFAKIDAKIDAKIEATTATLRAEMHAQTSRLVLWSFVFWVGAVGAVATLAGVLGR